MSNDFYNRRCNTPNDGCENQLASVLAKLFDLVNRVGIFEQTIRRDDAARIDRREQSTALGWRDGDLTEGR